MNVSGTGSVRFFAQAACLVWVLGCPVTGHSDEQADDGGFHSIAEYRAADPGMVSHLECENIDDLFHTRDIAKRLAAEKRVRLFRKTPEMNDGVLMPYWDMERKPPLAGRLGKELPTIELPEKAFRPILNLAVDFEQYGDVTLCGFHADVALLIGGDDPEYILICCFTCHDIHIIRRPTTERPLPQVSEVGMSPELERAIFDLARASYPDDKTLQEFKLAERKRSKTPVKKPEYVSAPDDPFAPAPKAKK